MLFTCNWYEYHVCQKIMFYINRVETGRKFTFKYTCMARNHMNHADQDKIHHLQLTVTIEMTARC